MSRPGRVWLLPTLFGLLLALAVLLAIGALRPRQAIAARSEPAAAAASEHATVASGLSALPGDEPASLDGEPARRLDVELRSHRAEATRVLAHLSDAEAWFEGAVAFAGAEAARYRLGLATPEREILTLIVIRDVATDGQRRLRAITPPAGAETHHARLIQTIGEYAAALSDVHPTELDWGYQIEQQDLRLFHSTVLGVAAARYRELPDNPDLMLAARGPPARR